MLTVFFTTLEQMVRILLFLLLGFAFHRLHILPKGAGAGISKLITTLLLPCLLVYTNMTEFNLQDIGMYGQQVLTGGLFWVVVMLVSLPISKKLAGNHPVDRGVFLYGLCFPNTGSIGTPLALALLGTSGLFHFNLFVLVSCTMTYAWGVSLFMDATQGNPIKRFLNSLRNPVCIAIFTGLFLGALNAKQWMPTLVTDFIGDLGSCHIPVSLFLAGYTIAEYPLGDVFKQPRSYVFTLLRLVLIPLAALCAARLLELSQFMAILTVLAFSCPCGMNVVVFPASYGQDCKTGASAVLLSCIGALLTVPMLYTLVHLLFP